MKGELFIWLALGLVQGIFGSVPVLIWGSEKEFDFLAPPLKKFSTSEFSDILNNISDETDNVVLFIEDCLDVDDLRWKDTNQKSAYPNIEKSLSNGTSKFFSYVKNPVDAFLSLRENGYSVSNIDNQATGTNSKNLFIVKFDDAVDSDEKLASFRKHDSLIHETCEKVKSLYGNVICVLTGSHSSQLEPNSVFSSRRLLQVPETDNNLNFFKLSNYSLFYTKQPPLLVDVKNNSHFNVIFDDRVTGSTSKQTVTLTVLAKTVNKNDSSTDKINLKFLFSSNPPRTWKLENITCFIPYSSTKSSVLNTSSEIVGSYGFSFHTPSTVIFSNDDYKLIFSSLQIELLNGYDRDSFSPAEDTVGFFTIPIWSGLFVTSLLVTIALVGLSLIFDIKTMDQFDDPKGKTVTINASD